MPFGVPWSLVIANRLTGMPSHLICGRRVIDVIGGGGVNGGNPYWAYVLGGRDQHQGGRWETLKVPLNQPLPLPTGFSSV